MSVRAIVETIGQARNGVAMTSRLDRHATSSARVDLTTGMTRTICELRRDGTGTLVLIRTIGGEDRVIARVTVGAEPKGRSAATVTVLPGVRVDISEAER